MADEPDAEHSDGTDLRQRMANGGWQLYVAEFLVLLVIFGWMFVTVYLGSGGGFR